VRRERVAVVVAAAAFIGVLLAAWSLIQDVNDYAGFVAGARALLAGESPYDPATWPTAYQRFGTQRPDTAVFGYPAWIALAFIPLAPLPIALGSFLWNAATLAAALVATRRLARRLGAPESASLVLAAASWPAFLVFLQGQWAYLLYALAVAAYLDLERGRDGRAGVWWAIAVLAKPQLFLLGSLALAAYLLGRRRLRALATAALVSVVAVGLSFVLVPGWLEPWLGAVASRRLVRSTQQPTIAGLAGDIGGDAWPIVWGVAVTALAIAILWAARRAPVHRGAVAYSGFLALSVGAALYSWSYDHYLAIMTGVVTLALTAGTSPKVRRGFWIAAFVLFGPLALALWLSAFPRFHDTGSGLVIVLATLLLVAASRAAVATSSAVAAGTSTEMVSTPRVNPTA
jgi:hypothetical protein